MQASVEKKIFSVQILQFNVLFNWISQSEIPFFRPFDLLGQYFAILIRLLTKIQHIINSKIST